MKTENKILMQEAKESLKGKWRFGVKVSVIYIAIQIIVSSIPGLGQLISLAIAGPFALGLALLFLNFSRKGETSLGQLFEGFNTWWRVTSAYLLIMVFVFLKLLLLIVPGIIAMFAYSQTFYILADDNEIGVRDAMKKSTEMMKGSKWKLFRLGLRFLLWSLLCILTLGIGFLWLFPWMQTTMAKFYDDVKNNWEAILPPVIPEEPATVV